MEHIKRNIERLKLASSIFDMTRKFEVDIKVLKETPALHFTVDKKMDKNDQAQVIERLSNIIGPLNIQEFVFEDCSKRWFVYLNAKKIGADKWVLTHNNRLGGMENQNKGAGRIVKTKTGIRGVLYNVDTEINGKYPVYLDNGLKMLCSQENLKLIGFID